MARCHHRLAARRRRLEVRDRRSSRRTLITLEHLLLAGVCVVCLVSMAGNVLSIVRAL